MTKDEAVRIIKKENLKGYNINEDRSNDENEVGIKEKSGLWIVYSTDERASTVTGSEKVFKDESDAWENFIKRLRASKILREIK